MQKKYKIKDHLKFIIPSLAGVFFFMTPIKTAEGYTIPIGLMADWIQDVLTNQLSAIMMIITLASAIFTIVARIIGEDKMLKSPFFHQLFYVSNFWAITRIIAAIFAVMVFFELGSEAIYGENTGKELLDGLLHVLFAVFLLAGMILPLLMNFGLLDLFGTLMTKIMRPLFKLPGRSAIDALASWVGDGTIGVLLTSRQYEDGYYTKQEASVISTTFSVVSITMTLVVIQEVGLSHMFVPFYLTVLIAGLVAALIMPRIPPLSRKHNTYISKTAKGINEEVPADKSAFAYGYEQAIERSRQERSVYKFFKEGGQNVLDMWIGVAPIVMAFGLIALIIAEYTPVFQWLGVPFIPLFEIMQIPNAAEASETVLIGFADMFLPAIIGSSIDAEITRFVVAALSVTQLIYMSEVGGVVLGSKIPVSFKDLFFIFILRTLITLPVIVIVAHILF